MSLYDVVTLGETMIRLTPPTLQRIEQTTTFDIHIGGSESNTAVGLARLGMRVCWLSRLTDNSLGRAISGTMAHYGVDIAHVVWTEQDRIGLYFYEPGVAPRSSRVVYDRAHSAMSRMSADEIPSSLFESQTAKLLHLTGITLAIGAADAAARALQLARAAGWRVSFDVNHRRKLWDADSARVGCEAFMQAANIIFIALEDAKTLYNTSADPAEALNMLTGRYPQADIIMTLGAQGAMARTSDGSLLTQATFPAGEVGRLGGGDAFAAGVLYAILNQGADSMAQALRWGAACAALKYSIPGDLPLFEFKEAEALVNQDQEISKISLLR